MLLKIYNFIGRIKPQNMKVVYKYLKFPFDH